LEENTIEINWEDAPEGTTHYDPNDKAYPWIKFAEGVWYCFGATTPKWLYATYGDMDVKHFVPKPEATTTVDSYTDPKEDPFNQALKEKQSEEAILALYLEAINSKMAQDETEVITMEYLNELFLNEVSTVQPKSTRASWYDYDKEELIGLPEKGEIVYDKRSDTEVAYVGPYTDDVFCIVEDIHGVCHLNLKEVIVPLYYEDSPTRKARKEQHKLLEDLVGDVDSNLQGMTHKGGAIELYNKGWRVTKEDA